MYLILSCCLLQPNGFRSIRRTPSGSEHLISNFDSELSQGARRIKGTSILGVQLQCEMRLLFEQSWLWCKGRPLKRAIKDLIMTLKSEKTTTMKSRKLSQDNKVTTTESR